MSFIDLIIAGFLIWFGYKGYSKGLVFELVTFVALGLGIYVGIKFSDVTADFLAKYFESEYLKITSYAVTFLAVLVLVFIAGKMIEKIINMVSLKLVNKVLGACFGVIKIGVILSILLSIVDTYNQKLNFIPSEIKENSKLYEPLLNFSDKILPEIEKNKIFQEIKSTSLNETE